MNTTVRCSVRWALKKNNALKGRFSIKNGRIVEIIANSSHVDVGSKTLEFSGPSPVVNLLLEISLIEHGAESTIVRWESDEDGFSFIPLHLKTGRPMFIEDLKVIVSESWEELPLLEESVGDSSPKFHNEGLPRGREIGWNAWAKRTNALIAPTVLGVPRDHRLFVFESDASTISAMIDLTTDTIFYDLRRAVTADMRTERSLEDGWMPILNVSQSFGNFVLEDTMFVAFTDRELVEDAVSGTPYTIAHLYSNLGTFPEGRLAIVEADAKSYTPKGEICLFLRTRMTNRSDTPLLAPLQLPQAIRLNRENLRNLRVPSVPLVREETLELDDQGVYWAEGSPVSIHRFNGKIPTSRQVCPLLGAGESFTLDSILSNHVSGLSEQVRRGNINWEQKFKEAKDFWKRKISGSASVRLPEKRLENFWKAGLAHLELVTLGEKEGPLVAKVGIYTCIGSESMPIVEFYDSIGAHDVARRCIDTFFAFQHASGRINTYLYYDIETGAALCLAGLHARYTKDIKWLNERATGIKAAADYLLSLRQMNCVDAPDYGLIAGTCADPKELTNAFMLNSYNAAGLGAVADMMEMIGDPGASSYRRDASHYIDCVRKALAESFEKGPVLPSSKSRWIPSCSSWVEGIGPEAMGLRGETSYSHRGYFIFNSLIGPLYAAYLGVIDPDDRMTDWMLELSHRQFNRGMLAESQPYYSRHPELHLIRGERDFFLNAFYSGLTSLADRSTFSFWEHFHKVSFHKTHEEAWALMQLRRMLWLESKEELQLLPGIPESWMDDPQGVEIHSGVSLFGSMRFICRRNGGSIHLEWTAEFHQNPSTVKVFLHGLIPDATLLNDRLHFRDGWLEIRTPAAAFAGDIVLEPPTRTQSVTEKPSSENASIEIKDLISEEKMECRF